MTNELFYRFGDVSFAFRGEVTDLPAAKFLPQFETAPCKEDISVLIRKQADLQPPAGEIMWQDGGRQVIRTPSGIADCRRSYRAEKLLRAITYHSFAAPDEVLMELRQDDLDCAGDSVLTQLCIETLLHRHGHSLFHASWVDLGGEALLFSGPSGIGKSTQARLWQELRGKETVNGDKTLLHFRNGRLHVSGLPFAGSSGICKNRTMPVRAVVMLDQGEENQLQPLTPGLAVRRILSQMPVQRWDPEDLRLASELACRIAEEQTIYHFTCRNDGSAVSCLENKIGC